MSLIGCYGFKALATTYRDPLDGVEGTWTNHLKIGSQPYRWTENFLISSSLIKKQKNGVVQKILWQLLRCICYHNLFQKRAEAIIIDLIDDDGFLKGADLIMMMDLKERAMWSWLNFKRERTWSWWTDGDWSRPQAPSTSRPVVVVWKGIRQVLADHYRRLHKELS